MIQLFKKINFNLIKKIFCRFSAAPHKLLHAGFRVKLFGFGLLNQIMSLQGKKFENIHQHTR
jgi:hypothetical protein